MTPAEIRRLLGVVEAARIVAKECVCNAEPGKCENFFNLEDALVILDGKGLIRKKH